MTPYYINPVTDRLTVIEYCYYDGQWTMSDSWLRHMVGTFRRKRQIFYNVKDFDKWSPTLYFRQCRMWAAFIDNNYRGAIWLSTVNKLNQSGFFNCGMRNDAFTNPKEYVHWTHVLLEWLLNRDDVQTVYGETSITNRGVLMLADYFGFKTLGIVPKGHYHADEDKFIDTRMMYITKELLRPLTKLKEEDHG